MHLNQERKKKTHTHTTQRKPIIILLSNWVTVGLWHSSVCFHTFSHQSFEFDEMPEIVFPSSKSDVSIQLIIIFVAELVAFDHHSKFPTSPNPAHISYPTIERTYFLCKEKFFSTFSSYIRAQTITMAQRRIEPYIGPMKIRNTF